MCDTAPGHPALQCFNCNGSQHRGEFGPMCPAKTPGSWLESKYVSARVLEEFLKA